MIIGIGNANYDLILRASRDLIERYKLNFAAAELVRKEVTENILSEIDDIPTGVAGGSVANSIAALAKYKVDTGFIGKVANDEFGKLYRQSLFDSNIKDFVKISDNGDSARCLCLVTGEGDDIERTMATYLGVAGELSSDDIDENIIRKADMIFIEGYLVLNAQDALLKALSLAKKHGVKIVFSLSAPFCIELQQELVLEIAKNSDIIFGNEEEWKLLVASGGFVASNNQIIVETMSERGAKISQGDNEVMAPTNAISNLVDVTGAGDAFAAGFLIEYIKNEDIKTCAARGNELAGKVIQKIGGRI